MAKYLLEVGGASKALLLAKGFSRMVIKQVSEAKGITIESRFKATKTTFDELFTAEVNIPLTDAQQAVYEPIQEAMNSHQHKTFLLHGVTGSGKLNYI
ncbi:MAG: hypothetical protein ACLR5T_01675 [Veillonella sp.]